MQTPSDIPCEGLLQLTAGQTSATLRPVRTPSPAIIRWAILPSNRGPEQSADTGSRKAVTGFMPERAESLAGCYAPHPSRFLRGRLTVERSWTGCRAARGNLRAPVLRLHLPGETRRDDLDRCQNSLKFRLLTADEEVLRSDSGSRRRRKPRFGPRESSK